MRWWRAPLVHFLAGGAVLFAIVHGPGRAMGRSGEPIVVSVDDVRRVAADHERETGRTPTPEDEAALVDALVDEEVLLREARARGLHRSDRSIRNWLVEQMQVATGDTTTDTDTLYARAVGLELDRTDLVVRRILLHKIRLVAARAGEVPPDEPTLQAFFAAHRDEYRAADRLDFWHAFFSRTTHGDRARQVAERILAAARTGALAPSAVVAQGETFATRPHVVDQPIGQVRRLFGDAFATEILGAPVRTWVGPVPSAYGVHLVWIDRRTPGAVPDLDAVRSQVVERWLDEQRQQRLRTLVQQLRRRYPLDVASDAWRRLRGAS